MRIGCTPLHILTLDEALELTVKQLGDEGIDGCDVCIVDLYANEILSLTESNLSLTELIDYCNNGDIIFFRQEK